MRAGGHTPGDAGPERDEHADPPRADENTTLRELRRQIGDDVIVDRFLVDFLRLLDDRMEHLQDAITAGRLDDAVTRLLSIETSSRMMGATGLAGAATALISALESGNPDDVRSGYTAVLEAGRAARVEFGAD